MATAQEMLTTVQFAERANVSPSTVSKWLRNGKIKGKKQGRKWMISAEQLPSANAPAEASAPADPSPASQASQNAAVSAANGRKYTIEEFSRLTYLTPFGVERFLREGRLNGSRDASGSWTVDASSLTRKKIQHLLR